MTERIRSVAETETEQRRGRPRRSADPTRRRRAGRVKVLVAVGLQPPPDVDAEPCVDGELLWLPPLCGGLGCDCDSTFSGCSSAGITPAARVAELVGVGRVAVLRALKAGMCEHCFSPAAAALAAEQLLQVAAAHRTGALLRRVRGEVVPLWSEESAGSAGWV